MSLLEFILVLCSASWCAIHVEDFDEPIVHVLTAPGRTSEEKNGSFHIRRPNTVYRYENGNWTSTPYIGDCGFIGRDYEKYALGCPPWWDLAWRQEQQ